MNPARVLSWQGLHNARDLGGLPAGSQVTQFGQFFRAPRPDVLTPKGWRQVAAAGVRTIVDLRNPDEIAPLPLPPTITRHSRPIEDQSDADFMASWGPHLNSPVYYQDVLQRWPDKVCAAFASLIEAPEGGILLHCSAGRDRTGMITAMLLHIVGVSIPAIVEDYQWSVQAVNEYHAQFQPAQEPILGTCELQEWSQKVGQHLAEFLQQVDSRQFLRSRGLSDHPLRQRLLGDPHEATL